MGAKKGEKLSEGKKKKDKQLEEPVAANKASNMITYKKSFEDFGYSVIYST